MAGEDTGARLVVSRIGEDDWRAWREVRLAALVDAPDSFAGTAAAAEVLGEQDGATGRSITEMSLELAPAR